MVNAQLAFLYNTGSEENLERFNQKQSQWNALKESAEKGDLNTAQMKEYRGIVNEAIEHHNEPYDNDIAELKSKFDIDGFYNMYTSVLNNGGSEADLQQIREKTGVTEEVQLAFEAADDQRIDAGSNFRLMGKRFKELSDREETEKSQREEKKKTLAALGASGDTGKAIAGTIEALSGAADVITTMVGGIVKSPRAFGSDEYGWTDELASNVESKLMALEGELGRVAEGEEFKNLPTYLRLSRMFGEGAGSMATMMSGGEVAAGISQALGATGKMVQFANRTGTWGTTYLSQLDENLQEGLDLGLTFDEARKNAHLNSAISATVEMIVPEGLNARVAYKELVKGGMHPLRAATKVAQDFAGQPLKEGAEEIAENVAVDVAKTFEDPAYQVFNPDGYVESAITGMLVGGASKVFGGTQIQHPTVEEFKRDAAENALNTIEDAGVQGEGIETAITDAGVAATAVNLKSVKQDPSWTTLDTPQQNHVLGLQDRITALENIENPTPQTAEQISNLSKEKDTFFALEQNGINPKEVGIVTKPTEVKTDRGDAQFYVNETGEFQLDHKDGTSIVVDANENAPRQLSEMGVKNSEGELIGGKLEERNILHGTKVKGGEKATYAGKPVTINRVVEKNGKITSVNLSTEDGKTIKLTEDSKGDAVEFIENLNRVLKGEEQVFLTKEEVKEEAQNESESVKLSGSETDTKVKQENSNLTLEPETLITEETQTPTEAGVAQDETLVETPLSESAIESEDAKLSNLPLDIKDARNIAENILNKFGFEYSFKGASDTNGLSVYFDVHGRTVRFSDHSISNKGRMENESLFYFGRDLEQLTQSALGLRYDLGDKSVEYGKFFTYKRSDGKEFPAAGFREKDTVANSEDSLQAAPESKPTSEKENDSSREAAKAKVDEIAEKLKKALKIKDLPEGLTKMGVDEDVIIDGLANLAKHLIDIGYSVNDAIRNVLEQAKGVLSDDEYKSAEKSLRSKIEEPKVKPASGTVEESAEPSVEKAKSVVGEERETRRKRKRESLDNSPSSKKIKSLSNTYKSVDAEKVKELAEEEFSYFKEKIDKGEDVVDELINYSDSFNVPVGTEFGTQLASIGQNLLQKALLHYRLRVDSGFPQDEASLEKVEKHIEEFNRRAATAMALANPKVNADELGVVLNMIDDERKSVLNSPTKSGKTVGDIIEEIREEGVTKDEVDEVASSISIDNIPKPSKSVSSKRKEQGLKKIKSGLSKLQSKSPTPLMALSPEKVEGIREIASGAVDLGIYGVEKITAYVKKQANKYVSEKDIRDTVEKYWKDGLEKMSSEGKMNEAKESLVKALQSGNQKGILNSFANAILMQDPEYAAMSKKPTKGVLDKVITVLQNKEMAETVVNEAINYVVNESVLNPSILNGLGLDKRDYVVSKSNPNGMTQEEFENFQRTVLQSNLKDLADTFLSSGVYETDLKDKRSTERKKNPTTESVQELVKELYSNPNINNDVLEQRLVDKLDISPEEAAKISQTVRDLLHRKIGKRSQSKIRGLIKDLVTNKSSDIQNVVARAMVTKGALNSRAFQNELLQYLGGKGMTSQDISKVIALANLYNSAPNNIVKNQYGVQMQNIIAKYNQSQGSLAFNFFLQNAMRGILGNPRTSIVTGSLSMLKTVPFDRLRQWMYRPATAMRARQYRKEMRKRGYSLGLSGARAIMNGEKHIQNRIEPDAINAFRRDSEWQRVRESAWSDLFKAIKTKDKGARTNLLLKSIQSITFMGSEWNRTIKGKKYELSPIVRLYNLMSAADLFAWTGITNFNTYYNAERQALLEGLKFGSKEFSERMGQLILTDPQIFNEIEKLAKDEAAQLAASGQPVPKTYVADRKKQLYREHIDNDIFNQASFEAEKSMLLNKPSTFIGASVQKWLNEWSAIKDDQSVAKSAMKLSFGSLFFFSRVGMNVISRRGKNIPVYNIATAIFPFEYEARDGKVIKRTKEDGSVRNRMKDQPREYAMGILSAATRTALVIALFDMMFDYDEEKDEKGNPVLDSDGNPIKTWKLNTSSPIQFHGDKEDLTRNQKRIAPPKCVEFTWVDDIDKRYWKFEWFPESWYTTLYLLGDKSDELRYVDDKKETALNKKGEAVERIKERDAFKPHNIFTSAAFGAFDASFMSIVQGVKNVKRQTDQNNYLDASLAVGDKLLIQPLSSVVSPRFAEQVSQSASYFKERNKAYVQLSVKNKNFSEGIGKIAEYAVTQTWLGELLTDTKDESIIMHDAHGYEVKYSPNDIMFIPALVSDDINFEWANHVSKHKVYELYLNEKGKFDESVLSPPNSLSFGSISVTEDVRNKVKLEAQKKYGKALESQFDGLKKSSINERASIMKYLWKYSVYEAKTEAGFSPEEPKWEDDTE